LVGFGLLSIFFPSLMSGGGSFVFSIIGIIVFAGLTAYDTQKIKQMNVLGSEGNPTRDVRQRSFGALTLLSRFHQSVPEPATAYGTQTVGGRASLPASASAPAFFASTH